MKRATRALCALVLSAGCGSDRAPARPQWTVALTTDAPVPQFGDRVFVELLEPPGCPSCTRQFGVADADEWPLSFGVVPEPEAVRLRIRLYRTAQIGPDGSPQGDALIDATRALPMVDEPRVANVALAMSCFGVASDPESGTSCDPVSGEPKAEPVGAVGGDPLQVGSWLPAAEVDCSTSAPDGMVCIPGGAYLLGDPRVYAIDDAVLAAAPERVVRVAPFFLDSAELTVRDVQQVLQDHPEIPEPLTPTAVIQTRRRCVWGAASTVDESPVNCVARAQAQQICEALGKRLPTEAEWEWAAGRRSAETRFPWGNDDDVCRYAIVGRAELVGVSVCRTDPTACGSSGTTLPEGPVPGGCERDLSRDGVRDFGGNLSEWVHDAFARYDDACFGPSSGLLDNPRCEEATTPGPHRFTTRGASWRSRPIDARVTVRRGRPNDVGTDEIGFRCAEDS